LAGSCRIDLRSECIWCSIKCWCYCLLTHFFALNIV
jgi:hypothetical protein